MMIDESLIVSKSKLSKLMIVDYIEYKETETYYVMVSYIVSHFSSKALNCML